MVLDWRSDLAETWSALFGTLTRIAASLGVWLPQREAMCLLGWRVHLHRDNVGVAEKVWLDVALSTGV